MILRPVKHLLLPVIVKVEEHPEDALHAFIHLFFGELSGSHRFHHQGVIFGCITGHFQIETGYDAIHPIRHRAPVRHDEALKAPVFSEHVRQQPFVFGAVYAVDLVVGAHNGLGLGFFDRCFKGWQIDFPQRSLGHLRGYAHPGSLLVIGRVVLDGSADVMALHAVDIGCRHFACQIRVFAHVLEVSAAQRAPLDADRRPQYHGKILRLAFLSNHIAHTVNQIPVKGGGRGAGGREADRLDGIVDSQVIGAFFLLAKPMRAVRHHVRTDSQAFHSLRMPEIRAAQQGSLFLQRHFRNQFFNVSHHRNLRFF